MSGKRLCMCKFTYILSFLLKSMYTLILKKYLPECRRQRLWPPETGRQGVFSPWHPFPEGTPSERENTHYNGSVMIYKAYIVWKKKPHNQNNMLSHEPCLQCNSYEVGIISLC